MAAAAAKKDEPKDEQKGKTVVGMTLPTKPTFMIFCGRPDSGKSYAIRSIIQEQQLSDDPYHFGLVYVKTKFNGEWSGKDNFIDDKYVLDEYSDEKMDAYMKRLEKWSKEHDNQKHPRNFIVLDDLQGLRDPNSPLMKAIVATYRHTSTSIFLSAQYLNTGTSTIERESSVYTFMFNTGSERSMKSWYQYFGQNCDSYDEFVDLLKSVTGDSSKHMALLYVQGQDTKQQSYFAWKAKEVDPDFKVEFPHDKKARENKEKQGV